MGAAFTVLIPARMASSRLPDKPLADIAGKPMVVRVAERALRSGAARVVVATDCAAVEAACRTHGLETVLTRANHPSGSDRLAEACERLGLADEEIVVNVQGDEPLISPDLIRAVASDLAAHPEASIATACHPLHDKAAMLNPNIVKVVADSQGYALYFSRAPIPYPRDAFAARQELPAGLPVYRHIGIYAYRAGFLASYASLPPAGIETFEALEQLRALWHGYRISVAVTPDAPASGVDTAADLALVRRIFAEQS